MSEPSIETRIERANTVMSVYKLYNTSTDRQELLTDLLADLMHMAEPRPGLNFNLAYHAAETHFEEESDD
jgi:hypothetical protein